MNKDKKFNWPIYQYEFLGAGLLLPIGLSLVIGMFGVGSR
jgi:hypothetical protein